MPNEFVKKAIGSSDIEVAVRQQEQLSYFTESSIQESVVSDYFEKWSERNTYSSDDFLNYAKSVFRKDNFIAFAKFLRTPIVSAELVDDRIKPELSRVFFSENSYFNYTIRGENTNSIDELNSDKFDQTIFNALLFNHNDIVVAVMESTNTPRREVISINNVVALDSSDSVIHRLAYRALLTTKEGEEQEGYLYMDAFKYEFLDSKFEVIDSQPHDLGQTPADYISNEAFSNESDIVRKSIFSKVIRRMENYVFLDTMLRMTEPNGVIPVTTQLMAKTKSDTNDTKRQSKGAPSIEEVMGSQKAGIVSEVTPSENLAQAGTSIKVPKMLKDDGSLDMEVVKNYFNFFHMPIEPLQFIEGRIEKQVNSLILSTIGDFSEGNEAAQNELQVGKGYKSKEDRLRDISVTLTTIRKASDFKFLALANGKDSVSVDLFFGSDFFTETAEDLYKQFKESPNPIEDKNILMKLSRTRNRFNPDKQKEETILNHLLPYSSITYFDKAVEQKAVSNEIFAYQTRFNYWVGQFEAEFGSVVDFWDGMEDMDNSAKIMVINSLILNIISEANRVVIVSDESATRNAQAELRGTAAGMTALAGMLTNLSESQAVEALVTFYGIGRAEAELIAKNPKEANTDNNNNN